MNAKSKIIPKLGKQRGRKRALPPGSVGRKGAQVDSCESRDKEQGSQSDYLELFNPRTRPRSVLEFFSALSLVIFSGFSIWR